MNAVLFWIVPPVVGAFIGYATNLVAIKMLFRPLKEIRVFGICLPFTPGILPKQRLKLADNIGRMVEQELLTPGVLRERLAREEVREKIGGALGAYTEQMLEGPLSYWLEEKPGDFPIGELLKSFFGSDVFDSFLEEVIRNWLGKKKHSSEDTDNTLGSWIKSKVRNFGSVFIPPARNLIKNGLVMEIGKQAPGETSIYRQALESIIEKYPGITLKEFLSLGKSNKQLLDSYLAGKAADAMDDNIENALSSVNVRVLVSDRINSLEMIRVEKIVLDVMAGQLKWINFFGGLLGGLIGFAQVVLSLVMNHIR